MTAEEGTCSHGISTDGPDAAACAYYDDHAHLVTTGPGYKRQGQQPKSAHVPVRFTPEMVADIRVYSDRDGMTVSAWVRKLVRDEIGHRITAEITADPAEVERIRAARAEISRGEGVCGVDAVRALRPPAPKA